MARYQGARTDGLFGIIGRILGTTLDNLDGTDGKWADRLALAGKGFDLKQAAREVGVQPRTNSKRSEAKSGQQSNVGTAPTLPAQQKGQQPNVGTAPTQPAKPKDLAEPAKGSEVKRTKTPVPQGPVLRIHAGLEDVSDLIADLKAGFERLKDNS